jgi:hypothetical protein
MKRTPGNGGPPALKAWCRSERFREIARQAIQRVNAERASKPKCGAKARSTGVRCGNLATENGKCRYHGGATPKGKDWHKPRWPDRKDPRAMDKLDAKLKDRERAAKKREIRLAAMSPEERERHAAWHRARKPGSPADRIRARLERKAAEEVRARLEQPPAPSNSELVAIHSHIEKLRCQAAEIEARRDAARQETEWKGVFS